MSEPVPAAAQPSPSAPESVVARMKALLDFSWDILSLMDGEGRLLYNSPAAKRLHGFDISEMEGRNTFEFFHPEDAAKVGAAFQDCLARPGRPVQVTYRYARKDGSWIWMEAVAVNLLSNPAVQAIVVNSRDISERKAHEGELERLNRLYEMLSRIGRSLIRIETREGLLQEICTIAVECGGFQLAWIGWVDPVTYQVLPVAMAGPGAGYLEGISVWADDRPEGRGPTGICIREARPFICQDFSSDPITVPWQERAAAFGLRASATVPIHFHGSVAGALMVYAGEPGVFQAGDVALLEEAAAHMTFGLEHLDSVEQKRRYQAELTQKQKMESLGSLAGGVAHDMNNVLGAILGLASANLEQQPPGSPAHQAFETISRAAVRGGQMVKRLLAFSRHSPSEVRELNLNEIVREEVSLLERTTLARVSLDLDLTRDLRSIQGDPSALTHAIMNLCVNAVDAMGERGHLRLHTRNLDDGRVELQVMDNGCGMTQEVLERAMDPFFTTKGQDKGTGLGLSIVYSTIEAHRGEMEIRSEPGRGTLVTLRFPADICRASIPGTVVEAASEGQSSPLQVLLVDDDDLVLESLAMVVASLGHHVSAVSSGEEALAQLESGLVADVVILDMNMPGLGGAGTLPRLRRLRSTLPVFLATGRTDQTALDLVQTHPHTTLLAKPFSLRELKNHLEAL